MDGVHKHKTDDMKSYDAEVVILPEGIPDRKSIRVMGGLGGTGYRGGI